MSRSKVENFSDIMSRSNILGEELEKQVAPMVIFQEEGIDPNSLGERSIPDERTGINFDLVDEKCENVFWVTHVTRGHFNKNFQKNLGELLFLKFHRPKTRCGIIIGKIPENYRPEYEIAYRLIWDAVYVIERKNGNWTYPPRKVSLPDETEIQVAHEIVEKQLERISNIRDIPKFMRFCSLPSLIGSSGSSLVQSTFERAASVKANDLTTEMIETVFKHLIEEWKGQGIEESELKTLNEGLTIDLLFKAIHDLLAYLAKNFPNYKISKLFKTRDWNGLLKLFPPYNQSSKFWDYYNPPEYLVQKVAEDAIVEFAEKVQEVIGCPIGFTLSTFLSDLGLNIRFKEDIGIRLRNGNNIVLQVKALSGGKGASGPKQAGYEAHRIAGLSFVTRWSYNRSSGEIVEKPLNKIVILDGYWKGPLEYPEKIFEYLFKFACVKGIFLIDQINSIKECLRRLLRSS
ncbi:MAG: hypothetical protein QXD95_07260 [Nitrososphaeria archaeon]